MDLLSHWGGVDIIRVERAEVIRPSPVARGSRRSGPQAFEDSVRDFSSQLGASAKAMSEKSHEACGMLCWPERQDATPTANDLKWQCNHSSRCNATMRILSYRRNMQTGVARPAHRRGRAPKIPKLGNFIWSTQIYFWDTQGLESD